MKAYINWWEERYVRCKKDPLAYPALWVGYVYLMHFIIRRTS